MYAYTSLDILPLCLSVGKTHLYTYIYIYSIGFDCRRPGGNPLDLNNLPEEYTKQALEESSTTTAASAEKTGDQEKLLDSC